MQLQQIVGPEVLDQVGVEHWQEVQGMQEQEQQDMGGLAEQAAADRSNEQQGHQILGGGGVTSVGGTVAGGGGLVEASTAASPTKRMRMTLPADPSSNLRVMGLLQAAAAAIVADTPTTVPVHLAAAIAGLAEASLKAQKGSPVARQRPAKATLPAKGGREVMGGSSKQPRRVRTPILWPSNSHEALPTATQVAADAGGKSGAVNGGGHSGGGGDAGGSSGGGGGHSGGGGDAGGSSGGGGGHSGGGGDAGGSSGGGGGHSGGGGDAGGSSGGGGGHSGGGGDAGGSSGGGGGHSGGGGSGSARQRMGHAKIELPKNWEASGKNGAGVGGLRDMNLDTFAKFKKGSTGRNPHLKQAQHQRDGPRSRVPPARMGLEGAGGSRIGGHGMEFIAGQQQDQQQPGNMHGREFVAGQQRQQQPGNMHGREFVAGQQQQQQQGGVQGRNLLGIPVEDVARGLRPGSFGQGVAAVDGVVAMGNSMGRGIGEGGGVGVRREGPPGPGCKPTPALRGMTDDQQQAFVVEVAALLRIAIREQQAMGHGNMHLHIVEFLKLCEQCHSNVCRLLSGGNFNRAVAFFLCHPEVFEVQQMTLRLQPWDPVHWKAGRERSPGRFSAPREEKLVVGLTQGDLGRAGAGENLLWVNERGQRLGEELQVRVVEVVKQRGLWEGL